MQQHCTLVFSNKDTQINAKYVRILIENTTRLALVSSMSDFWMFEYFPRIIFSNELQRFVVSIFRGKGFTG